MAGAGADPGARRIVREQTDTLDHEAAPEIAGNLEALYDYFVRELVQVNLTNEGSGLKVVERLLRELRETWVEAIGIAQREESAASEQSVAVAPPPAPTDRKLAIRV